MDQRCADGEGRRDAGGVGFGNEEASPPVGKQQDKLGGGGNGSASNIGRDKGRWCFIEVFCDLGSGSAGGYERGVGAGGGGQDGSTISRVSVGFIHFAPVCLFQNWFVCTPRLSHHIFFLFASNRQKRNLIYCGGVHFIFITKLVPWDARRSSQRVEKKSRKPAPAHW